MTDALTVTCPAKVNLALSVGAPREDGFHPIASWMVTIGLCDELVLRPSPEHDRGGASTFDIAWADDAPSPSPIDWPLESDLIVKAHALVEQHVGRPLPVRVTLTKRIPVGAGLAGGSSDGAGMLRGLNELFALDLPRHTLIDLSMKLGSDLAFFFSSGSAMVTGRGEGLEELPMPVGMNLALLMPSFGCSTGGVYRAFDEMSPTGAVDEQAVREVAAGGRELFNDLAAPACAVERRLAALREQIHTCTGRTVHVTGSGAGMFIVANDARDADDLAKLIRERLDVATRAVAVGAAC